MSVVTKSNDTLERKVAKHQTNKTTFSRTDELTMHCALLAKTMFVVKLSCMPKALIMLRCSTSL